MGNSLGDETSCENSTPPNIFNSQCISAEWPVIFEKKAFENFTLTLYTTKLTTLPVRSGVIGSVSDCHAEDSGSRLKCATSFFFFF